MPLIVTLVHGTWAENAPWTREGSALRLRLMEAFGSDVSFRIFPWSGDNSFSARSVAACDLRTFLRQGFDEVANTRNVIIAHSHGGNVALEAVRKFDRAEEVAALVCLATPFITTRIRKFGQHTEAILGIAKLMTSLAVGAAASVAVMRAFEAGDAAYWMWISLSVWSIVGLGTWRALSKLSKAWVRHAEAWAERVGVSAPEPPTKLFVVRAAADEAFEGLTAFRFPITLVLAGWAGLAWIALLPLTMAAAVDDWARQRFHRRLITATGLWLAAAGYVFSIAAGTPNEAMAPVLLMYVGALLLVGAVSSSEVGLLKLVSFLAAPLFVLLGAVFLAVLLLLSLVAFPFNTSSRNFFAFLKAALWLGPIDVSAEPAPPGEASAMYQMSEEVETGLRHSSPYDDPASLQKIVAWMRELD